MTKKKEPIRYTHIQRQQSINQLFRLPTSSPDSPLFSRRHPPPTSSPRGSVESSSPAGVLPATPKSTSRASSSTSSLETHRYNLARSRAAHQATRLLLERALTVIRERPTEASHQFERDCWEIRCMDLLSPSLIASISPLDLCLAVRIIGSERARAIYGTLPPQLPEVSDDDLMEACIPYSEQYDPQRV